MVKNRDNIPMTQEGRGGGGEGGVGVRGGGVGFCM